MKIFIGQRVTGEDIGKLKEEVRGIYEVLRKLGHEHYCTFMEGEEFEEGTAAEKMRAAFNKLNSYDTFLAVVRSESRSEGLLMEIGHVISSGKKLILAINKDVKDTYLRELADEIIEFESPEDLLIKLENQL